MIGICLDNFNCYGLRYTPYMQIFKFFPDFLFFFNFITSVIELHSSFFSVDSKLFCSRIQIKWKCKNVFLGLVGLLVVYKSWSMISPIRCRLSLLPDANHFDAICSKCTFNLIKKLFIAKWKEFSCYTVDFYWSLLAKDNWVPKNSIFKRPNILDCSFIIVAICYRTQEVRLHCRKWQQANDTLIVHSFVHFGFHCKNILIIVFSLEKYNKTYLRISHCSKKRKKLIENELVFGKYCWSGSFVKNKESNFRCILWR